MWIEKEGPQLARDRFQLGKCLNDDWREQVLADKLGSSRKKVSVIVSNDAVAFVAVKKHETAGAITKTISQRNISKIRVAGIPVLQQTIGCEDFRRQTFKGPVGSKQPKLLRNDFVQFCLPLWH